MSLGLNARRRRTTLLLEGIGLPQTLRWRDFRLTAFTVLLDGRLSDSAAVGVHGSSRGSGEP